MPIIQLEKESLDVVQGSKKVNINRFASDFSGVDTLGELQLMNIFSHFEPGERENAETELFGAMPLNALKGGFDFNIPHVNGTQSWFCGIISQVPAESTGVSINGDSSLNFSPQKNNWLTSPFPLKLLKAYVNTNIVVGDAFGDFSNDPIRAYVNYAWQNLYNSVSSGSLANISFRKTGFYDPEDGSINTGPVLVGDGNIGDEGTMLGTCGIPQIVDIYDKAGYGGSYIQFYVKIPANARTKTYKLRFEVEYE